MAGDGYVNKYFWRNIVLHSFVITMLAGSWFVISGISQRTLTTYKNETARGDNPFTGIDGFTATATMYTSASLSAWLAAPLIQRIGCRNGMALGGFLHLPYFYAFIYPRAELIYIGALLLGFGSIALFSSQGEFVSANSDESTITRNNCLVWASINGLGACIGNAYIYFAWSGVTAISSEVRVPMLTAISILIICVSPLFWLVKEPPKKPETVLLEAEKKKSMVIAMATEEPGLFSVLKMRRLQLFLVYLIHYGLQTTFYQGILPFMITSTRSFGDDSDKLSGLYGIVWGSATTVASLALIFLSKQYPKFQMQYVVYIAGTLYLTAYSLCYVNFNSDILTGKETGLMTLLEAPSLQIAFLIVSIIGFCDGCTKVIVYNYLSNNFKQAGAASFVVMTCFQSLVSAVNYILTSERVGIALHTELAILAVTTILSMGIYRYLSGLKDNEY